jgi:hypothetical protein
MAMRLNSATGRPLAALALLATLCACASTAADPSGAARSSGWRIVERTGEARYLPPESAAWMAATTGQALSGGSEVATGPGGRLIVDAPGRNLSVGPDSRFVLPGEDDDAWLEQRGGWLRYRIAAGGAHPFRIHTRSLELELSSGVVDVHVNHLATEVTVKEGQVRVATPDGLRQTQMLAGQTARAGEAGGAALALRLAPGEPLQTIEPVVVPASQPKPAPAGSAPVPATAESSVAPPAPPQPATTLTPLMRAGTEPPAPPQPATTLTPLVRAGTEPPLLPGAADPEGARPQPLLRDPAPANPAPEMQQAGRATPGARTGGPSGRPGAARVFGAIVPATRPTGPAAVRRSQFERLTAGVLDGIQPPHPALFEPNSIR